jgi:Peptidase family C25
MPLQRAIPKIGTSAAPSWTVHDGKEIWLAWKGEGSDTGVYVTSSTSLRPDLTTGEYHFNPQQKVLALATPTGPVIASLNGVLYLFLKGESDDHIYWATSSDDGAHWVDRHLLALGDSLVATQNDQHPQTSSSPAVVAANNCLYMFWRGLDNKIMWTAGNGGAWAAETQISTPAGAPETDASPAIALQGQTIHLVWKGNSDGNIFWSTYSTPVNSESEEFDTSGPWSAQTRIFPAPLFTLAISAPAIVCDGNSVVWVAWTGEGGGVQLSSLRGSNWTGPVQRPGIASSGGPTLASTGDDAQDIVMAWKGEGNDPGVYYGSLTGPLPISARYRNLLVIAPQAFMADVQPLIDHKNKTGMTAISASIESIVSYFPGVDAPEQIKQAICYATSNLGTMYVLLVGDATKFPVRFWFLHGSYTPTYPDGTVIPCQPYGVFVQSDLYYANLWHHTGSYPNLTSTDFSNWDDNGNGLYNESWMDNSQTFPEVPSGTLNTAYNPDDVDGYPDVCVGRIPAGNNTDLKKYVNKVIAYETRPAPPILTFTFVVDLKYGDFGTTSNLGAIVSGGNVNVDYLMIENDGNPTQSPFLNVTPKQLATQAGVSNWVSYIGHGSVTSWGQGGGFTSDDVALTINSTGLPIVFSTGCATALFMPNVPWNGYSGEVTSTDNKGVTRGPFEVNPKATPGAPGIVITDTATGRKWGFNTPGSDPLPVSTPKPAPLNVSVSCCANQWLFDSAPGGAIAYIGDHCVSNDSYPAEIETHLLSTYVGLPSDSVVVLGDSYLFAQRQYWAGSHSGDATTSGLNDYHGIPRLYLGWMVLFGDPSLRLPRITR